MIKFLEFIEKHIVGIVITLLILMLAAFFIMRYFDAKDRQAQIMTAQQAQNMNALENKLKIAQDEARTLSEKIIEIQNDKTKPDSTFIIQTPSPAQGVKEIQTRIIEKDPTLPKEALEKTDRTVVVEQPKNKDYKVGVYKINLRRKWEIGVGAGTYDNHIYQSYAIKRNYDKYHSIELQAHFQGNQYKGFQVMYYVGK